MANIRKLSAFRQLSLNCESPKEKRKILKKQLSEDLTEVNDFLEKRSNFKQQFDNKGNKIKNRPIKIAWDNESLLKDEEPVIVKKCKEIKRPVTSKLTKQTSIDKDSILYSKQNLAKRLRQVFETPEERKLNLNIFLTQNYQENANEVFSEIESTTNDSTTPKIRPPLLTTTNNNNVNLFQIRRNKHEMMAFSPRTSPQPPKTVVVPIKETELSTNNDPKPIDNVIIRPNTAAMKRERFQKRTNSAFHSVIKEEITIKPPLVRAVSAPISADKSKSKFIASKRKIKTNRKKKIKDGSDEEINNNTVQDNSNSNGNKDGILENLGNDVVTMVSLVSPSASDCEDSSSILPIDKAQKLKKDDWKTNKNLTLRKTIKSVSFQQSTIHAIRSFSASFPARRNNNSMVVANLSTNNRLKGPNLQEKRTTTHNTMMIDDGKEEQNDQNSPKRKLLKDTQGENCINDDNNNDNNQKFNDKTITVNITNKTTKQQINNENDIEEELEGTSKINCSDKNDTNQERNDTIADSGGKKIKFGSVKEKECWEMFHKMTDKGIKVSYDAILRGMLTPTEYRLRNKEIVEN